MLRIFPHPKDPEVLLFQFPEDNVNIPISLGVLAWWFELHPEHLLSLLKEQKIMQHAYGVEVKETCQELGLTDIEFEADELIREEKMNFDAAIKFIKKKYNL